jgi:hypothetical protein
MLRYSLDNLGWFEFEGLSQTLLKARLGLGVEAWGGSGDWGRDAYCAGALTYPTNDLSDGPFLFQCKFVAGANAAGAKSEVAVLNAVRAELQLSATAKRPAPPAHYVLLTNARLGAATRQRVGTELNVSMPQTTVHIHDGNDLCAWLDITPEAVRSFPLLWSLRNLGDMLRTWVNADVLTRSRAALEEAEDIANVFVPTRAYSRALEVLGKHSFVVLEGPPEMGKTAIGRMISLSMVARGWEAIECGGPADVEANYERERSQVFLADDFFGRTEYDSRRGSAWGRELPHILRLVDGKHWLVLTTRAHLLNLAKQLLDIPGRGRSFPAPAEVTVNATELATVEKGRMLYRHLKHENLPEPTRLVLRTCAKQIVANPNFTPERIRRLVAERFRDLIEQQGENVTTALVLQATDATLRSPTKQMMTSFRSLRQAEKWLLFALVEGSSGSDHWGEAELETAYERLCPPAAHEPFAEVLAAMSDAFVRRVGDRQRIDWIHPSCRDLVIAELARSSMIRRRFMKRCSISGIRLALSFGGGSDGGSIFPLLRTADDWRILCEHACESLDTLTAVLSIADASSSISQVHSHRAGARLDEFLLAELWPAAVQRLNEVGWSVELFALHRKHDVGRQWPCPEPDLKTLWAKTLDHAQREARDSAMVIWGRSDGIVALSTLAYFTEEGYLPRAEDISVQLAAVVEEWAATLEQERLSSYDESKWGRDELYDISASYSRIAEALSKLRILRVARPWSRFLKAAQGHFESESRRLSYEDEPYDKDDYHSGADVQREADIGEMFKDL